MHKDPTEIFFRGQFKLEPHPHWSPLGVSFEFSDEHPHHFSVGVGGGGGGALFHLSTFGLKDARFPVM